MFNFTNKNNQPLPDNQIRAGVGPCFFQGTVLNFFKVVFGGLLGYACYLQIKGKAEKSKQRQGSSGSNGLSKEANYTAVDPTILTHSSINSLPLIDYHSWQLLWKFIGIEDIAILYCEPGVGKSVLAHQIAYEIAVGQQSAAAPSDEGAHDPQIVLYYDAEMTCNDYKKRYPLFTAPDNMNILMDFYFESAAGWMEDVQKHIPEANGDMFVVLDNLTSAFKNMSAEEMRHFLTVQLRECQKQVSVNGHHITFLIVAHPNKEGVLAGVANLQNFGTSILHMKKVDDQYNEIVVEKCRNYGEIVGHRYVLQKSDVDYMHFEYVKESKEEASFAQSTGKTPTQPTVVKEKGESEYTSPSQEVADKIRAMRLKGMTDTAIAKKLNIRYSLYINRWLEYYPEVKENIGIQPETGGEQTQ